MFSGVKNLFRIRDMKFIRCTHNNKIYFWVIEYAVKISGEFYFGVKFFVLCKLRYIFLASEHVLDSNVIAILNIRDMILANAHAKTNISNN